MIRLLLEIVWYAFLCVGALCALSLLITNRWGDLVFTHNWRVSRRLDKYDRKQRR